MVIGYTPNILVSMSEILYDNSVICVDTARRRMDLRRPVSNASVSKVDKLARTRCSSVSLSSALGT